MTTRCKVLALAIGAWTACLAGCTGRAHKHPSVLLVTLEGIRADRLGAYGYARAHTQHFDAIAREGLLFERAYTAAPLCLPAATTILTGRSPGSHGVREDAGVALAAGIPLISEAFLAQGYRTAAFPGSSYLGRSSGLSRGFQEYVDDFGAPGRRPGETEVGTARESVDAALRWLATAPASEPVLTWVHLRRAAPSASATAPADDPYDASVAATDVELGRLLDGFKSSRPDLAVAILADHGEALGEHAESGFGYFIYSATTHVPLLISVPDILPKGRRVGPIVRTLDVTPTLLDIAGVPAPSGLEGASLVPLMTGRVAEGPGPAPIENMSLTSRYGLSPLFALRSGAHLYVRAPQPELYDSEQDPGEKANVAERLTRVATRLDTELRPWAAETQPGLPDPKDALDLYHRYREAQDLDARGERTRAIDGYRAILKERPSFVFAQRKLADALMQDKRTSEAVGLMEDLLSRKLGTETTYLNLALARFRGGDKGAALRLLLEGASALPESPALHHRAGRLLLELKRSDEAVIQLTRATELEPQMVDAQLALGEALGALKRNTEAQAAYRRVLVLAKGGSSEARDAGAGIERLSTPPAR
jgi:choline-sulfatase